jgi:hypothetical protein
MPLLPFRRFDLISDKSPSEVEVRLRNAVAIGPASLGVAPLLPFEGEVREGAFTVHRAITYRNSFLPRIRGTIAPAPEGSRIRISMSLYLPVLLFMLLWLSGMGAAFGVLLVGGLRRQNVLVNVLGPAAMFIFGWALAAGAFTYEARKVEPLLADVLAARPK